MAERPRQLARGETCAAERCHTLRAMVKHRALSIAHCAEKTSPQLAARLGRQWHIEAGSAQARSIIQKMLERQIPRDPDLGVKSVCATIGRTRSVPRHLACMRTLARSGKPSPLRVNSLQIDMMRSADDGRREEPMTPVRAHSELRSAALVAQSRPPL